MKVTVLGSGLTATYPGLPYRYPASHLMETNGQKILLDVGIGAIPQLAKIGFSLLDINAICISHYHADHFAIEPILQAFYSLARAAGKKSDLQILGPSDIEERVKAGYRLKGWTFEDDLLLHMNITFRPYEDGKPMAIAPDVTVTPFQTKHFAVEAYAVRVEGKGPIVAYSGDSVASPALEVAARNADIFLCEAALDISAQPNAGHLNLEQIGALAQSTGCKRLVLVHYSGNDKPEAMIEEIKATGFSGQIDVAQDLSVYD